jgi:hypothetical protein
MANRTPLFNRVQPGGVFTISDVVNHPGDIWWVDYTTGVDGAGYGQNPDAPCKTINYAYDLATASKGDVIYVMPGHEETIMNATTLVADKAGISIIGLGRGMNRPIINFGHTTSQIIVSGASQRFSNLVFNATVTGVVLGIAVAAHDFELDNCYITWETTASEFVSAVSVALFDRFNIHDNVFDSEPAGGAASAISLNDTNDGIIARNVFRGFWTASAILGVTVLSARLLILDNVIYNSVTTVYGGIDLGALASTGIVKGNTITALYATAVAKTIRTTTTTTMTWHENSVANAVAERAILTMPATAST